MANNPSYAGNAAAMREALEEILEKIDKWRTDNVMEHWQYSQLFDIADHALAAPPRNCDVGTEQEQIRRWERFCQEHHEYWKPSKSLTAIQRCNCPCLEGNNCNYFIWAQMPYEEGGAE